MNVLGRALPCDKRELIGKDMRSCLWLLLVQNFTKFNKFKLFSSFNIYVA